MRFCNKKIHQARRFSQERAAQAVTRWVFVGFHKKWRVGQRLNKNRNQRYSQRCRDLPEPTRLPFFIYREAMVSAPLERVNRFHRQRAGARWVVHDARGDQHRRGDDPRQEW